MVPDAIYVSVPTWSIKEKKDYPLAQLSQIIKSATGDRGSILLMEEDYGPLTKLLGPWSHERGSNTIIITIDDDQLYSKNFVETLVQGIHRHPNSCICMCGHVLGKFPAMWGFRCSRHDDNPIGRSLFLKGDSKVTIISGWCGCAYPRNVLGDSLPKVLEELRRKSLPLLNRHDDMYISSWLFLMNVPKYVVTYSKPHDDVEMDHAKEMALSSNDGSRTPITMMKHLMEWWKLARELQSMGLLETDSVPWNKSTVMIAGACVIVSAASIVMLLMIMSKNNKNFVR
jgi:hypothetical protein